MKENEKKYLAWENNSQLDKDLREELAEIKDNYSAIEDRFCQNLQFGTGGLRGLILKFYFSVNSKTQIEADAKLKQLKGAVLGLIDF